MKRSDPRTTPIAQRLGRFVLVGGLTAALFATLAPVVGVQFGDAQDGRTVTAQGANDQTTGGPLATGSWQTVANGDRVNRLLREGRIVWSATDGGGLVRWDLDAGTYKQYLAPQSGLPSNVVHDIEAVGDGSYWLGTAGGLVHFFPSVDRFDVIRPVAGEVGGMPGRVVTAVLRRPDGRLWVGFGQEWDPKLRHVRRTEDGAFTAAGLAMYDPATNAWSYQVHASVSGEPSSLKTVPSENITDLALDTVGNLWVGTKRYEVWQHYCPEGGSSDCVDAWVPAGGGVAVTDLDSVATSGGTVESAKWSAYRQESSSGGSVASSQCYSDSISMLRADVEGRMWVATLDRGLLLFRKGLAQRESCTSLPRYTTVVRSGVQKVEGLRGKHVFSVDIDENGCLWIGHGSGPSVGQGIAVLCHKNTFDDSSISDTPWISDDEWQFFTFSGQIEGETNVLVSAIVVEPGATKAIIGTRDDRAGDGYGVAEFTPGTLTWVPYMTAANGLPSNQIADVKQDPVSGDVWYALKNRGVARQKPDGNWNWWKAFGPGREVTQVKTATAAGTRLVNIPVKLSDKAAFDAIFSGSNRYIVIGDDPTRYRVTAFKAGANGLGPWITIQPNLQRDVPINTPIYLIDRGPASNEASEIAFGKDGKVYVGGRESIWMSDRECSNPPECWLDGGLGVWNGSEWFVYTQPIGAIDSSGLLDQMVKTVTVDLIGRIWIGFGDQDSTQGDGISVLDPATNKFTHYYIPPQGGSGAKLGSNGVADLDVDPANGNVWAAHFPTKKNNEAPDGTISQVLFGGGASRWNGTDWTAWKKDQGALIKGYGLGTFNAILADRVHNLAWLGGWDAVPRQFHWTEGRGVNAALNWCGLDNCTKESWQSRVWLNEGEVNALALDKHGAVWVSMNRRGLGLVPPFGGVRLFDGVDWYAYNPSNTPMSSLNVTSLAPFGDGVYLGTMNAGVTIFSFTIPPTATPAPTFTPSATPSSTPVNTVEPTPTLEGSPTRTATRGATPTPTRTQSGGTTGTPAPSTCAGGWCSIYLPYSRRFCSGTGCPKRTTPRPTIPRSTADPSSTPTLRPPTASPTGPVVPTIGPSPTDVQQATPRHAVGHIDDRGDAGGRYGQRDVDDDGDREPHAFADRVGDHGARRHAVADGRLVPVGRVAEREPVLADHTQYAHGRQRRVERTCGAGWREQHGAHLGRRGVHQRGGAARADAERGRHARRPQRLHRRRLPRAVEHVDPDARRGPVVVQHGDREPGQLVGGGDGARHARHSRMDRRQDERQPPVLRRFDLGQAVGVGPEQHVAQVRRCGDAVRHERRGRPERRNGLADLQLERHGLVARDTVGCAQQRGRPAVGRRRGRRPDRHGLAARSDRGLVTHGQQAEHERTRSAGREDARQGPNLGRRRARRHLSLERRSELADVRGHRRDEGPEQRLVQPGRPRRLGGRRGRHDRTLRRPIAHPDTDAAPIAAGRRRRFHRRHRSTSPLRPNAIRRETRPTSRRSSSRSAWSSPASRQPPGPRSAWPPPGGSMRASRSPRAAPWRLRSSSRLSARCDAAVCGFAAMRTTLRSTRRAPSSSPSVCSASVPPYHGRPRWTAGGMPRRRCASPTTEVCTSTRRPQPSPAS